jgi:PAS domain S-box-containing protein
MSFYRRMIPKSFKPYAITILAVALSVLARLGLGPWLEHHAPFVTFYVAIFLSSWRGGTGPAILATVLSLIAVNIFFQTDATAYGSLAPNIKLASSFTHLSVALVLAIFARIMDFGRRKALRVASAAIQNETELNRSKQSLQFALDAGSMASWEWDIPAGTVSGSPGLASILRLAPDTFDGSIKAYLKAIDLRDRANVMEALQQAISGNTDFRAEFRLRDSLGSIHWVEGRGRLVKDEDTEAPRMIGILSNITLRKEAEATRARLSAIVESSADAIIGEDLDGRITSWNDGARRLLGYKTHEALGKKFHDIIDPLVCSIIDDAASSIQGGGLLQNHETTLTHRDGHTIWVSISFAPIHDEKGEIIGVSRILRDITPSRKARDQELVLTEATALLSISLEQDTSLSHLSQLLAAKISDICLIECPGSGEQKNALVAKSLRSSVDISKQKYDFIVESMSRHPLVRDAEENPGNRAYLHQNLSLSPKEDSAHGAPSAEEICLQSVAIIPLAAHGQTYGSITLISLKCDLAYDDNDRKFLEELGRRAALAIENARLFAEAQFAISRHEEELRERIRIEDQLRQSERLYRAIGESIDYGIWICNAEGRVVYISEPFLKIIGISIDKWSDYNEWDHSLPETEASLIFNTWKNCVESGSQWDQEITFKTVHGEDIPVLSRGVPVRDEYGNIQCWAGIHLDISRQKKAEAALIRAKEEADAANAAKSRFLANMSHEIRTPLGAIVGFSEILASSDQSPKEKAECAAIIKRNGSLLSGIINDILDLSKVEAGHFSIEKSPIDLLDLLNDIRSGLSLCASEKNLCLSFECAAHLPSWIETDAIRLKQILTNIVGNAIKFTEKGFVTVRVSSRQKQQEKVLRFEVEDSGCGLSQSESNKLFEPFSQADASTTRQFGGTGLGLALSRRLAQLLGGNVFLLRSTPSEGSTFVVEIPQETLSVDPPLGALGQSNLTTTMNHSLMGMKVLVVEDSPDNRLLMTTILRRAGAITDVAENGLEGVKKAMTENHHVILMDVQMPVMDGYVAATQLRQQGYSKPIIALTAHALMDDRLKCLKHGFDDHISKPVTPQQLIQGIMRYSSSHQAVQQA